MGKLLLLIFYSQSHRQAKSRRISKNIIGFLKRKKSSRNTKSILSRCSATASIKIPSCHKIQSMIFTLTNINNMKNRIGYKLRPNACIAISVAPELFSINRAYRYLLHVEKMLMVWEIMFNEGLNLFKLLSLGTKFSWSENPRPSRGRICSLLRQRWWLSPFQSRSWFQLP